MKPVRLAAAATLAAHAPTVTGTSGSATVNAEPAQLLVVAIVPTVTGDTPAPAGYGGGGVTRSGAGRLPCHSGRCRRGRYTPRRTD